MSIARRPQYSKEVRDCIIATTQRIISEEGLDVVSVRRIAGEMDYSPGIVYHYFRNKDDLLSCAVREGYRKLLLEVKMPEPGLPPDRKLRECFRSFVDAVLQAPNAYKFFVINYSSGLFRDLAAMDREGPDDSPAYGWIVKYLAEGNEAGLFACDPFLTAKVFWCAGYGLLFRVLIEPDIPPEQRDALIQRQFDILLKGIAS